MTIFVTDERPSAASGNDIYPVRRFAGFYLTSADGLNCPGESRPTPAPRTCGGTGSRTSSRAPAAPPTPALLVHRRQRVHPRPGRVAVAGRRPHSGRVDASASPFPGPRTPSGEFSSLPLPQVGICLHNELSVTPPGREAVENRSLRGGLAGPFEAAIAFSGPAATARAVRRSSSSRSSSSRSSSLVRGSSSSGSASTTGST